MTLQMCDLCQNSDKPKCLAEPLIDLDYPNHYQGYWAKGHWTGTELLLAARWDSGEKVSFNPIFVRQTFYRQVPFNIDGHWELRLIESKPGRGAFPVTVYEGVIEVPF